MTGFYSKLILSVLCIFASTFAIKAQNYNIVERSHMDWPGQTLANICGYTAPDGKEYALVGASKGMVIVDISNPDQPVQIVQIPMVDNLWKEIKVYKHYAYITTEGGGGLQIVDLSGLPSSNLNYHFYTGTGTLAGQLNAIHALHIDTTKGFVYLFGGGQSGATIHALEPDPYNPTHVGGYLSNGYIHDGYANNDTLYAGHIYAGRMAVVDCSDKSNPVILGDVTTPGVFTHNCWPLTSNRHIMLTTDEVSNSFLASYDTQDPDNIVELDRMQTTPGSGSIVHNTHIRNDFAVTSWYTDGVTITDATRPINLVQVARFDTYPGSGDGFDGCWGAFPFFPSGTIVTSNIGSNDPTDPSRMYILTPTYKRACYLEGVITDGCTGLPLKDAVIKIASSDPLTTTNSNNNGVFRTGQPTPGQFTVTIEKPGYTTFTQQVTLVTEQVTNLAVTLDKGTPIISQVAATMQLKSGNTVALSNKQIRMLDPTGAVSTVNTNALGIVDLTCVSAGQYKFGYWGAKNIITKNISQSGPVVLTFQQGYYDDCEMDFGWDVSATSPTGLWIRDIPVETNNQGTVSNPGVDASTDANTLCYITGNGGGQAGADDVDNGNAILITPPIDMVGLVNPAIRFQYWFYNGGGQGNPNDRFEVRVSNGTTSISLLTVSTPQSAWIQSDKIAITGIPITNNMRIEFIATDDQPGHLVEAGVDVFEVVENTVGTFEPSLQANLDASPNPFAQTTRIAYRLENTTEAMLEVVDISGKLVSSQTLQVNEGSIDLGNQLHAGVYMVRLRQGNLISAPVKLVKI